MTAEIININDWKAKKNEKLREEAQRILNIPSTETIIYFIEVTNSAGYFNEAVSMDDKDETQP